MRQIPLPGGSDRNSGGNGDNDTRLGAPVTDPRVVLVGGSSGGIGRATALMLAARGDHLVLTARGVPRLEEVAALCSRAGAASTTVLPADVADRESVEALLDAVALRFGRLDGVVHTAGVAAYGRFVDVPPDIFERVVTTNLVGTANMARGAMRRFAEQDSGGRLVLVGSLLGKIATPFMSPYVTSKWAVHGLVRVLQIEVRTMPGVDVSLVSPGGVDTPIYRWSATFLGRQGQPPPPVDPPEKVARAVVAALDKPRRESSVGVANPMVVFGFRALPAVYDAMVTPLMQTFGLEPDPAAESRGNLFESQPQPVTSYGDRNAAPVRLVRAAINKAALLVSRIAAPPTPHPTPTQHRAPRQEPTPGREAHPRRRLEGVAVVERVMDCPPAAVWTVLADGWFYANWVVGASRTRAVDSGWPAEGAHIHHSFGLWPLVLDDTTEVLASERQRCLHLLAKGRPVGAAEVWITLTDKQDGTTRVEIQEDVTAGPGLVAPRRLRQLLITPRNTEALRRLALLAEGRSEEHS